jgi:hypothetical protein
LDITYCNNNCTIGIAARDKFLAQNNSVFDAAFDFNCFVENCFKSCPHKEAHMKQEEIAE